MPTPKSPPLRTTPLAHVILAPGGASFEIDGRSIRLAGEEAAPSLSAFHAFHDAALADYHNRPPPPKPPGLLSRLKSWLGNFFLPKDPPNMGGAARLETLKAPPELRTEQASRGRAAPPGADAPMQASRGEPLHLPKDRPSPSTQFDGLKSAETPLLQSAFADKEGVHLTWQTPSQRAANEVSFICRLDSDVAHKLQECYTQLGKLGYKVVGLDALSKEAEASPHLETARPAGAAAGAAPRPAAAKEHPAPPKERAPAASLEREPSHAAPAVAKASAGMPAIAVMTTDARPQKSAPDLASEAGRPTLAAAPAKENSPSGVHSSKDVRAAEKHDKTLVLDLSREDPPEDRLTFLRGTLSRTGLKIAEVGLGEGKDGAPARWEDAARWFARHAEPEPPKPDLSPLPDLL